MPTVSAGLLLFRRAAAGPQVLLGHMGGPFWARKDQGAWTVFKGLPLSGEDLLAAPRRGTLGEPGLVPGGPFLPLAPIRQAGGKRVRAWATETCADPATLRRNAREAEWAASSGRRQSFPEIDRFAWLDLPQARRRIIRAQVALLDELEVLLAG